MKKFTLIELLVVISIIGILMTLLIPSLSKARAVARQAVCLSNQHQVYLASFSYMLDSDGWAPTDNVGSPQTTWHGRLKPAYIPEKLLCPDGMEVGAVSSTISMNVFITGRDQNVDNPTSQKSTRQATSSETCMLMDSYKNWRTTSPFYMKDSHLFVGPLEENIARHNLKANVTFLDGHGVAKSVSYLLSKRPNQDTFWDPEQ